MEFSEIYDISLTLGKNVMTFPGDPPFLRKIVKDIKKGDPYTLSRLSLSSHAGTHVDAPSHFGKGQSNLDSFPMERFILPALVVEINNVKEITRTELEHISIPPNQAILFKTENSRTGISSSPEFHNNFVYLTEETAQWCVEKKCSLVGIDYASIDSPDALSAPAHQILAKAGIINLETINLAKIEPGNYTLICLPLKIKDAEGAPARAVLVR